MWRALLVLLTGRESSLFRWVVVRLQFLSFALCGAGSVFVGLSPRLAPWAAFFRRFAAWPRGLQTFRRFALRRTRGLDFSPLHGLGAAAFGSFAALRLGGRGV